MALPADALRGLRVAFAGTPEFARVALERVHAACAEVPLVLTQPDRPAGRGLALQPSPVKAFALAHGLPVAQPAGLKLDGRYAADAAAAQSALVAARIDVMVVAAYGLILPAWVLALPRLGCLNIHASLLPRWRGAAPIHRAIEAGDAHTGITIMQMDAGLDTGDMLLTEAVAIQPDDTTALLHDRLAALGGDLVVRALHLAAARRLEPRPQPPSGITYAHKIDKSEAPIDWRLPAEVIERRIRAFDPFPGATTVMGGQTLKLWRARAEPGPTGIEPGQVLQADEKGMLVACGGNTMLRVTDVQRPGGRRVSMAQFLQGHPPCQGAFLGQTSTPG